MPNAAVEERITEEDLNRIAMLNVTPEEAITIMRRAGGTKDLRLIDRIGDAFQNATWHLLISRQFGEQVYAWYDALRQVGAFHERIRDDMRVLANLVLASHRFGVSRAELGQRDHVDAVLAAITWHGPSTTTAELHRITGYTEFHLHFILRDLVAFGRVNRMGFGSDTVFSLA